MKTRKIIVGLMVGVILIPSVSFAQSTQTREQLTLQLIQLLLKQIELLQTQLATMQNNSKNDTSTELTETSTEAVRQAEQTESDEVDSNDNLEKQEAIIKKLKAIDDECSPSGCDYGERYQQEWNQLIDELKAVGGTYEGSCLFDLVGDQNAISPGNRHLTWRCVGWGG